MITPFSIHFKQADIPIHPVADPPFEPSYPMPFVAEARWANFAGQGCRLIYRTHDGYNMYVAMLEVQLDDARDTTLTIPVESQLHDLHLVYQLSGTSHFPGLIVPPNQHTQLYAPPSRGSLLMKADPESRRYAVCAIVPRGKWVARDIADPENPLYQLILCLKAGYREFRYLAPTALSPQVHTWIQLLLSTRPYPHLLMDNALNQPLANLLEVHLRECGKQQLREASEAKSRALVDSARIMAAELLGRLRDGNLPELAYIAGKLHTTPDNIRKLHYAVYGQKFSHYVIQCRIAEAHKRLRQGDSITSVAFALGWTDDTYFIKQFKKHTGMTPGEFVRGL